MPTLARCTSTAQENALAGMTPEWSTMTLSRHQSNTQISMICQTSPPFISPFISLPWNTHPRCHHHGPQTSRSHPHHHPPRRHPRAAGQLRANRRPRLAGSRSTSAGTERR